MCAWRTRRICWAPRRRARAISTSSGSSPPPKASGADAVHPGYGFLSENADFRGRLRRGRAHFRRAARVRDPRDGFESRRQGAMAKAGVPVVPGYHGEDARPATTFAREAKRDRLSGADQGGCGRRRQGHAGGANARLSLRAAAESAQARSGVRVRRRHAAAREVLSSARATSRCRSSPTPMATVVTLFERDCTLQRRHQKVIEEAPSPALRR